MKGGKRKAARRVREEGGISGRRRRACRGILTIPAVSGARIHSMPENCHKMSEIFAYVKGIQYMISSYYLKLSL